LEGDVRRVLRIDWRQRVLLLRVVMLVGGWVGRALVLNCLLRDILPDVTVGGWHLSQLVSVYLLGILVYSILTRCKPHHGRVGKEWNEWKRERGFGGCKLVKSM
jgi:hypothetical protein